MARVCAGIAVLGALAGSGPLLRTSTATAAEASAAVPGTQQIEAARRYAQRRRGVVSFAVVNASGRLRGHQRTRPYWSASLIKAMILVAYLDRLERRREPLTAWGRSQLEPMIRRSDNDTATRLYRVVGRRALRRVAHRAGMERFVPRAAWGSSQVTAEDQARFFHVIDGLVPARHRDYARRLLASIVATQRWGIPQAAPARYLLLFKGGWRRGMRGGRIVHQVARLETGGERLSIAVLTDANPSHRYGTETIRGVAARLLR